MPVANRASDCWDWVPYVCASMWIVVCALSPAPSSTVISRPGCTTEAIIETSPGSVSCMRNIEVIYTSS